MSWLQGKKTYLVSGLIVLVSLLDLITGDMDIVGFLSSPDLSVLLNGVGLGTLRAGVAARHDR